MSRDLLIRCALAASMLAIPAPSPAQAMPPTYQFDVPAGWTRTDQAGSSVLLPPGGAASGALLVVLPSAPRQPDLDGQFNSVRTSAAAGLGLRNMREASRQSAPGAGVEKRLHAALYSSDQGDRYLIVMARADGPTVGTVLFLATGLQAYQQLWQPAADLFHGMRLPAATTAQGSPVAAGLPSPAAPPPGKVGAAGPSASGAAAWKGGGIVGVWMGLVKESSTDYLSPFVTRWKVFFNDGMMFADLPDEGLAGFERAAYRASHPAREGYWHTYSFAGTSGESRRPGTRFPWSLRVEKVGQLLIDDDVYHRCASVDGLRLDGAWSSYSNPDDPTLDQRPVGQRPLIRFSRDGRFVDDGLFASFLTSRGDDRPGAGRYELRDFTLLLHYDDGRTRQEAFSGLLGGDPAVRDGKIYIRRTQLSKRSRR
jgi:hypothetical protein